MPATNEMWGMHNFCYLRHTICCVSLQQLLVQAECALKIRREDKEEIVVYNSNPKPPILSYSCDVAVSVDPPEYCGPQTF